MAHNLYSRFAIQNTFMSTVVLINEVSEVLQRHYLLSAILLVSSIFAQLPTLRLNSFSTKILLAFWVIPIVADLPSLVEAADIGVGEQTCT